MKPLAAGAFGARPLTASSTVACATNSDHVHNEVGNFQPALLGRFQPALTGVTADGLPVHGFQSLLADLATLARNTIVTAITPDYPLTVLTRATPVQRKAFELLGVAV
jgi:hypothetical protein